MENTLWTNDFKTWSKIWFRQISKYHRLSFNCIRHFLLQEERKRWQFTSGIQISGPVLHQFDSASTLSSVNTDDISQAIILNCTESRHKGRTFYPAVLGVVSQDGTVQNPSCGFCTTLSAARISWLWTFYGTASAREVMKFLFLFLHGLICQGCRNPH